jgi:hypothetical protein
MNRYVLILLLGLSCFLTACGYTDYLQKFIDENGTGSSISGSAIGETVSGNAVDSGEGAGSSAAVSSAGIYAAENVTKEMQTAAYWIGKAYAKDKVLLSAKEIQNLNQINKSENDTDESNALKDDDFLVVTGRKLSLTDSGRTTYAMGSKLELAAEDEASDFAEKNKIHDNYIVKIPVNGSKGKTSYELTALPLGEDVHLGYLEYTRSNILTLSMTWLGCRVDGKEQTMNQVLHDIFSCFGFEVSEDGSKLPLLSDVPRVDVSLLDVKEKKQKLESIYPGAVLMKNDEPLIYLGCMDGQYYVLGESDGIIGVQSLTKTDENEKSWLEQLSWILG